jgi:uncharacterized protein
MSSLIRSIQPVIKEDLKQKMVFIGGPRQVGKTTLATSFLKPESQDSHPAYLNWDDVRIRRSLTAGEIPSGQKLIVLDEIHKYKKWRGLVKGLYDTRKKHVNFIITGSARLDHYRKGGDSLMGRYHYHRLHPLSLREISKNPTQSDLKNLLKFGGFPEPFLRGDERFLKRWSRERLTRVLSEDLRDLEYVKEISLLELLLNSLPVRIGSQLSLANLAQDLEVNVRSIERWLTIFENLYLTYRIAPYGPPKIRAVKKTQKIYFWDWSQCESPGSRFENLVASQLLKYCHFLEDTEGEKMELRYMRDVDGREVDFVVIKNKIPLFAVECKTGETQVAKNLAYFKERTVIPKFYQVHLGTKDYLSVSGVRVLPFHKFTEELHLG